MKPAELIDGLGDAELRGDAAPEIASLAFDSERVEQGSLFFCVRGERRDGHEFAPRALERGAAALVVERPLDVDAPQIVVPDARAAMAPLAARFFGDPTAELRVAGVTGTNGKTTTAFLLRTILEAAGVRTGLVGTVRQIVGGEASDVVRTTPEAIDLQATFRRMLDAGDRACVMEASSHALALHRADAIRFEVAAFTNLTQDHLDFHADMEEYFLAKRILFAPARGPAPRSAVVNADDPYGRRLAEEIECATFSVSGERADYRALDVAFDAAGSRFRCAGPGGEAEASLPLPGHFNVENALCAIACACAMGVGLTEAAGSLAGAERVPGRFEAINEGRPFTVLVDYAHTPDSLENVLRAARRLTTGRLVCVFGCGGDRDRDKRPLMGAIAARLADACTITSDNPRSEDPEAIVAEVLAGARGAGDAGAEIAVEVDRRAAIVAALAGAREGDVVVVAGKGHEQGQEFADGRKVPFDDATVIREELRGQ